MDSPVKSLDTRDFCVFCLRKLFEKVPASEASRPQSSKRKFRTSRMEETMLRFSSLIGRHLNADFSKVSPTHNQGDKGKGGEERSKDFLNYHCDKGNWLDCGGACQDCLSVVEEFCEAYFQLKKMELVVDWEVRKLKSVVECSGKAPTRIRSFRNEYKEDKGKLEEVEAFRKEFVMKSGLKFLSRQPKIHLQRRATAADSPPKLKNLPGHVIGEGGKRLDEAEIESQPVVHSIVKREPEPVAGAPLNHPTSASPFPMEMEVEVEAGTEEPKTSLNPNQALPTAELQEEAEVEDQEEETCVLEEDFGDFDSHDNDDEMEVNYEYSSSDRKILPKPSSPVKAIPTTKTDPSPTVPSPQKDFDFVTKSSHEFRSPSPNRLRTVGVDVETQTELSAIAEADIITIDEIGNNEGQQDQNQNHSSEPASTILTISDSDSSPSKSSNFTPPPPSQPPPPICNKEDAKKLKKGTMCSICNKLFPSPALLAPHMFTHTDAKYWPFHCKYCDQRMYRVADFKRHRASIVHMRNKKAYKSNKVTGRQNGPPQRSQPQRNLPGSARSSSGRLPPPPPPIIVGSPTTLASMADCEKPVKIVRIIYMPPKDANNANSANTTDNSSNANHDDDTNANNSSSNLSPISINNLSTNDNDAAAVNVSESASEPQHQQPEVDVIDIVTLD